MILMTESLDGLAGFLGIVTGNYFCAKAAPPGMLASLTGLLGAAVYGAGYYRHIPVYKLSLRLASREGQMIKRR